MTVTSASGTPNLTSMILQQLLAGSNAPSTSGLSPTVLKQVLDQAGESRSAQAPVDITQALGNLLSGNGPAAPEDLAKVQGYFKAHPDNLGSLLSSLQGGAGTYGADGTLQSGNSLLTALGLGSSASPATPSSLINLLLGGQSQDPLLASLGAGGGAGASRFSMLG